jgi:hypothetical protein
MRSKKKSTQLAEQRIKDHFAAQKRKRRKVRSDAGIKKTAIDLAVCPAFRLDPDLFDRLNQTAIDRGIKRSDLLREILSKSV